MMRGIVYNNFNVEVGKFPTVTAEPYHLPYHLRPVSTKICHLRPNDEETYQLHLRQNIGTNFISSFF